MKRRRGRPAVPEELLERGTDSDTEAMKQELLSVVGAASTGGAELSTETGTLTVQRSEESWEGAVTLPSAPQAETTEAPVESEEVEWEPDVEGAEVLDDPVRMYLREIGRVHLLTSKDERVLARKMGAGNHLEKLETKLWEAEGRPPRAWEVCHVLLQRLGEAASLVGSLGENLGLPRNLTLSQTTDHPKLRAAIDAELNPELMASVSESLEMDQVEVDKKVIQLSLDSGILPTDVTDGLEDCTLEQLIPMLESPDCDFRLQSMEMLSRAYFDPHQGGGLTVAGASYRSESAAGG